MPAPRVAGKIPADHGPKSTHLESCAEQIPDPVERLRYLRRYYRPGEVTNYGGLPRWILAALAVALAFFQASDLTMRKSADTHIHVRAAAAPALPPVSV